MTDGQRVGLLVLLVTSTVRSRPANQSVADALVVAGGGNEDLPHRCRQTGPHVRGWWVVVLCDELQLNPNVFYAWQIRLFTTVGKGTLAPWNPTQRFVVRGIYRHVRNPMIVGVSGIRLGEAVFLGSLGLLEWFAIFVTVNLIYIPLRERQGALLLAKFCRMRYPWAMPVRVPQEDVSECVF
jgi:protein-S-isoprenylcysteine O-methyltransferase Ste14